MHTANKGGLGGFCRCVNAHRSFLQLVLRLHLCILLPQCGQFPHSKRLFQTVICFWCLVVDRDVVCAFVLKVTPLYNLCNFRLFASVPLVLNFTAPVSMLFLMQQLAVLLQFRPHRSLLLPEDSAT